MFSLELFKASLTAFFGVVIFIFGQLISKFYLEPAQKLLEVIGEIQFTLSFYANTFCNPGTGAPEQMDQTSKELREKASLLLARTNVVRGHRVFTAIRYLPKRESILEAYGVLIRLSNSVHHGDYLRNVEDYEQIKQLLNLNK